MLFAASVAAVLGLIGASGADAVPADVTAFKGAAIATSPLQSVQFYGHRTRHGVVKCYRTLVIGSYRCHHFYRPFTRDFNDRQDVRAGSS
jgi:hypothetical protein